MHKKVEQVALALIIALPIAIMLPTIAKKPAKPVDGKQLFQQNCASCHQDGSNKVNPNHPIAGSKELATLASFKSYLKAPPGHMPYYEHIVNDDAILKALYTYCKTLKKENLKQMSFNGNLPGELQFRNTVQ